MQFRSDEIMCASSSAVADFSPGHSRLFGFFTALPGLWRMFQCFRRYYDTRSAFPHLVNAGKYTMTVLSYMSMSLFRLHRTTEHLAVFCVFSVLNAVYCSTWDLVFDWSRYPLRTGILSC